MSVFAMGPRYGRGCGSSVCVMYMGLIDYLSIDEFAVASHGIENSPRAANERNPCRRARMTLAKAGQIMASFV